MERVFALAAVVSFVAGGALALLVEPWVGALVAAGGLVDLGMVALVRRGAFGHRRDPMTAAETAGADPSDNPYARED